MVAQRIDDITSFDPAESYEFSNNEIDANCYRRLVSPDPADAARLIGDIAESWEIGRDGASFTFHLRSDASFASGRTLTAADAAFSLARAIKLDRAPGFILTQFGFRPDTVEHAIRAPDDTTLVIDLPQPAAPGFFLRCLSANIGSIVDRAEALAHAQGDDFGNAWLRRRTEGAGAWRLAAFEASDHVSLDRNPHAGAGQGGLAQIFIRHIPDPSAQLLLLEHGDIDIARDLTADQLSALGSVSGSTITASAQASSMYLAMNQSHPMLRLPAVIEAIKWAIDLENIAAHLTPRTWEVCQSFLPSCLPDAIPDRPYRHDLAKARALLHAAGAAGGFDLTLDYVSHTPDAEIAQVLQANLGAVGITVRLVGGEQKQVISKTRQRRHQLALMGWGADYFDPNSNAQAFCERRADAAKPRRRGRERSRRPRRRLCRAATRLHGARPVRDAAAAERRRRARPRRLRPAPGRAARLHPLRYVAKDMIADGENNEAGCIPHPDPPHKGEGAEKARCSSPSRSWGGPGWGGGDGSTSKPPGISGQKP